VADAVGTLAMVLILPEDIEITSGSPKYHRAFLDIYLSQFSRRYLSDLIEYHRILKQRNALLKKLKSGEISNSSRQLDAWDDNLIKPIIRIVRQREKFVTEISPYVKEISHKISASSDEIELIYRPRLSLSESDTEKAIIDALKGGRTRDIRMGATMLGPHRDMMELTIGGVPLESYGSMGQKKTVLMSLKLAALRALSEHRGEPAILILDEAFAAFDSTRSGLLLDLLSGLGQVFLASAIKPDNNFYTSAKIFEIESGAIKEK
jgi:DNA replication and repair protein RecF